MNSGYWPHLPCCAAFAGFALAWCFIAEQPVRAQAEEPPVILLSFDTDMDDAGPHRLRAEAHGDEVLLAPGRRGQALFVGGTEDWLDLPLEGKLSLPHGVTLSMWLRRDDWTNPYRGGSGWQTVAAIDTGLSLNITAPGCPMHKPWALHGSAHHRRKDVEESESASVLSLPDSVPADTWLHAALVYDPASETMTLYLNGARVDQARGVFQPDFYFRQIRLGTWHKANQAYRGLIDEVACYDYPLSAQAIAQEALH
jgi:hypothetical protein